jgi:sulfate/thiosulfate transport system substrate-binding protein
MRRIRIILPLLLGAAILSGAATGANRGVTLTLVAYSTPKVAYSKIIPAFQSTAAGKGVGFTQSYGPSGDQSRAVSNGLNADVVAFSLAPDVSRLIKYGLVAKNWDNGRYHGMVTDSVVVIVVRPGNPKHIHGWTDLTKKGVQVLTPNPFTSGGARWNVMAAYGAQRKAGKTDKQAIAYLVKLFKNVVVQDKSARESLQTFSQGKGDAMLAYENEAIFAKKNGVPLDYFVPRATILIENPVAVVKGSSHTKQASAFVRFLVTPQAQQIFGENGYRPVLESVAAKFHFPKPSGLFTINQLGLGGWGKVQVHFFDSRFGVMARVEKAAQH